MRHRNAKHFVNTHTHPPHSPSTPSETGNVVWILIKPCPLTPEMNLTHLPTPPNQESKQEQVIFSIT